LAKPQSAFGEASKRLWRAVTLARGPGASLRPTRPSRAARRRAARRRLPCD
jgi:hypothetical protein